MFQLKHLLHFLKQNQNSKDQFGTDTDRKVWIFQTRVKTVREEHQQRRKIIDGYYEFLKFNVILRDRTNSFKAKVVAYFAFY